MALSPPILQTTEQYPEDFTELFKIYMTDVIYFKLETNATVVNPRLAIIQLDGNDRNVLTLVFCIN